jgi:LAGLIDADG DNA endonuclease family
MNHPDKLSDYLNSVLIGIILGDGFLYRSSATANTRFEMSFGYKYKLYAENIELLFKDYISNSLKEVTIKGKDRSYINYRLKTKTLPIFNQYHDLFYEEQKGKWGIFKKVKIVPANIEKLLDPIVLAYLIQSDGSFSYNRVRIYTNSFTKAEVELLAKAINTNFSIFTGVTHDRNNQWILTIGSRQLNLLREIVSPYFVPSMLYRIGL